MGAPMVVLLKNGTVISQGLPDHATTNERGDLLLSVRSAGIDRVVSIFPAGSWLCLVDATVDPESLSVTALLSEKETTP